MPRQMTYQEWKDHNKKIVEAMHDRKRLPCRRCNETGYAETEGRFGDCPACLGRKTVLATADLREAELARMYAELATHDAEALRRWEAVSA